MYAKTIHLHVPARAPMIDVASFCKSWGVFRDLTPLKTPAAALDTVLNMTAKRVERERRKFRKTKGGTSRDLLQCAKAKISV